MHPWICLTSMPAIAEPPSRLSTSLGTCSEYIACTLSVLTWHAFLPLWLHRFDSAHIFSCVAPFGKNILTISLSSFPNTNLLHRFRFFWRVFLCVFLLNYSNLPGRKSLNPRIDTSKGLKLMERRPETFFSAQRTSSRASKEARTWWLWWTMARNGSMGGPMSGVERLWKVCLF